MSKPIVYFGKIAGWRGYDENGAALQAVLTDISEHPRLGDEALVTTSRIVRLDRNEAGGVIEIETLNTIYRQREVAQ